MGSEVKGDPFWVFSVKELGGQLFHPPQNTLCDLVTSTPYRVCLSMSMCVGKPYQIRVLWGINMCHSLYLKVSKFCCLQRGVKVPSHTNTLPSNV